MKIVKIVLLVIAVIIAIPLVIAIFVSHDYEVKRDIVIEKPGAEVFAFVSHIRNQAYYNKWVLTDPQAVKTYSGNDASPGFVYRWDGQKSGAGEQEIKNISEGRSIETELRFKKPMEGLAATIMTTEDASGGKTKVSWTFKGRSKYPMNIMNLFIDKVLGGDMSESLSNLKRVLETGK